MNVRKLKGIIAEKGLKIMDIAMQMKINESTLYRKLKVNGEAFTVREVHVLVGILSLSNGQASEIFLDTKSHICDYNIRGDKNATNNT